MHIALQQRQAATLQLSSQHPKRSPYQSEMIQSEITILFEWGIQSEMISYQLEIILYLLSYQLTISFYLFILCKLDVQSFIFLNYFIYDIITATKKLCVGIKCFPGPILVKSYSLRIPLGSFTRFTKQCQFLLNLPWKA